MTRHDEMKLQQMREAAVSLWLEIFREADGHSCVVRGIVEPVGGSFEIALRRVPGRSLAGARGLQQLGGDVFPLVLIRQRVMPSRSASSAKRRSRIRSRSKRVSQKIAGEIGMNWVRAPSFATRRRSQ